MTRSHRWKMRGKWGFYRANSKCKGLEVGTIFQCLRKRRKERVVGPWQKCCYKRSVLTSVVVNRIGM